MTKTPTAPRKTPLKHMSAALDGDLAIPLVVDFDGTMQLSDMTLEALLWVLGTRPWLLGRLMWLYYKRGRAAMKLALEGLAENYDWIPVLPWEERVLERIAAEKARGRTVVIVTGSTTKLVKRVVDAKGLDYEVVGTERADTNLTGPRKAAALIARWGAKKFDYIGNSKDDFAVWSESRYALVVGKSKKIRAGAAKVSEVVWMVDAERYGVRARLVKRLRRKRKA